MNMDFSPAQYDAVIAGIERGIETATAEFNTCLQRAESYDGWIHFPVNSIKEILNEARKLFDEFLRITGEILRETQIQIPPAMWGYSNAWQSIAARAGQLSSHLVILQEESSDEWTSIASGKYQNAVNQQTLALNDLVTRAGQISTACQATSVSGYLFYIAVAAAVGDLLAGLFAAGMSMAAAGVDPLALAAAAAELAATVETAVTAIGTAIAALALGNAVQKSQLKTAINQNSYFPKWPFAGNPVIQRHGS